MDLHGYGPHLLTGVWLTIKLGLLSLVVAGLLGILGALAKLSSVPPLRLLAQIYTTLVRGIPDLVLMLIIFYGGQIALNQAGEAWGLGYIDVNPFIAGVLTLGVIFGAYMTETFRGAILAVPKGQMEAARALGMGYAVAMRRVILPQVLPGVLSGSLIVFALSASALAIPGLLGGRRLKMVATLIYDEYLHELNWPLGAAIALVLLVINLAVMLSYNAVLEGAYKKRMG